MYKIARLLKTNIGGAKLFVALSPIGLVMCTIVLLMGGPKEVIVSPIVWPILVASMIYGEKWEW